MMSFWGPKSRRILANVGSRFYVVFGICVSFLCRFTILRNLPLFSLNRAQFSDSVEKILPAAAYISVSGFICDSAIGDCYHLVFGRGLKVIACISG